MVLGEKLYTVEEFWEFSDLPENELRRLFLIEGELREMTPAGEEHGDIASEFNMVVRVHVKKHNLGRVTAAETGYVLYRDAEGKDTVLAPDIGFTSWERANKQPSEKFAPNPPDLAVEVVSPNDRANDVQEKVLIYLKYGTKMVVLLYPRIRTVFVHTKSRVVRLTEEDTLTFGDVLPEFSIRVRDIFVF